MQQNLVPTPGFARSPDPCGSLPSRGVKSSVGHQRSGLVRSRDRVLAATRPTTFPPLTDDWCTSSPTTLPGDSYTCVGRLRVGAVRDPQTREEPSAPAHGDGEPVRTCVSVAAGGVETDL